MSKIPDYLQINEGNIVVTLHSGVTIDGAKIKTLTMREPLVQDTLAVSAISGNEAEKELGYFANLCSVAPDDLKTMTMRDYTRLQTAFGNFTD